MQALSHNLRRLMARNGMTLRELVTASGLHERTVKAALAGNAKPHPRTLHRLARGLDVSTDELFRSPTADGYRSFDRHSNPAVGNLIAAQPELFNSWTDADFEELFSQFGTGGELTAEGAARVAAAINEKRAFHRKVALLLESSEAKLLSGFVDLLYQKISITQV